MSPIEERIVRDLVERLGEVVPNEDLIRTAWLVHAPTLNALHVHLNRLRRRIGPRLA